MTSNSKEVPTVRHLDIPAQPYSSYEAYADAESRAQAALEQTIRQHLNDGNAIRESLADWHCDWTRDGSDCIRCRGEEVVYHLVARFLAFGTTLQFLPDARPRCGNLAPWKMEEPQHAA
ncbi:MAG: hypothetical protein WB562_04215 [Candidatus Sulfotelmatobacter sp.]